MRKTNDDLRKIKSDLSDIRARQREQLLARLIGEVKTGRAFVAAQKERIAALDAQLEAEQKNSASLSVSYAAAAREVEQLRLAVAHKEQAIALQEQTIATLTGDNARLKAEAKKSRRHTRLAMLAAGVLAAILFR